MAKLIPVTTEILRYDGRRFRVQQRDEDGEPVWEVEPNRGSGEEGRQKLKSADTLDIIELMLGNLPREVQKAKDGLRSHSMLNAIMRAREEMKPTDGSARRAPMDDEGLGEGDGGVAVKTGVTVDEKSIHLLLRDEVYEWFHGLFDRKLPLTKEAKDSGIKPFSLGTKAE